MFGSITIRGLALGEGLPKICVPLTGKDLQALSVQARAAVEAGADLVEWRVDFWEDLACQAALRETADVLRKTLGEAIPLLATLRTSREGSVLDISDESYASFGLFLAGLAPVDLVDVEVLTRPCPERLVARLQEVGVKVIASSHNFRETPPRDMLLDILGRQEKTGADLLKLACMPQSREDVQNLMQAVRTYAACTPKPLIAMSMGDLGRESRICGAEFGSCLTFGTAGPASAPGQMPVGELRKAMALVGDSTGRRSRSL